MKLNENVYWFGVTATFKCKACHQENIERFVITHIRVNVSELNQKARFSRTFKCQKCAAPVDDVKEVDVSFLSGTPAHLSNKGFPVASSAFASK